MKRFLQGMLVLAVVAPLCGTAGAETMVERKQRIMRKYLRERQNVVQSDMANPDTSFEDEQIQDSEKFKKNSLNLSREQTSEPMLFPAVPSVPVATRRNWMLEEPESDADPYADPFAVDRGESSGESGSDMLTSWRDRQVDTPVDNRQDSPGTYNSYNRGSNPYSVGGQYGYGNNSQSGRNSVYPYGTTQPGSTTGQRTTPGRTSGYGSPSYGTYPSGLTQLPVSTPYSDSDSTSPQSSTYTPYKSPYQVRQEQRSSNAPLPQQQQEFKRETPYQQWKSSNQSWDPTADDAYLDELMRRNQR